MTDHTLEVRDVTFDLDGDLPRTWHGAGRAVTHLFNNLSTFFPAGERFFIQAVRAHVDAVDDPQLREEMRKFYAQEAMHTREHARYNARIARQGYPIHAMETRVAEFLERVKADLDDEERLAVTCALEHLTALLADALLEDPRTMGAAHPGVAALWRWHAAEESEHKAVAFDVHRAIGGTQAKRARVMVGTTLVFLALVAENQVRLMAADGLLWSAKEWGALARFLWRDPGALRGRGLAYLAYFKPGFHPWQHDNRELLARWKRKFAREEGYRPAALAG